MQTRVSRNIAAIGVMLMAYVTFAGLNALVKLLGARYAPAEIAFFRSLFGMLPLLALMPWQGGWQALKTQRPLGHLGRGLAGGSAMVLLFWTFQLLPLADGVAIGFATGPLFVALFAILLLREAVTIKRWMAIAAGFMGVVVMVNPGGHSLNPFGVAVALSSSVSFGLAMTGVRSLGRTEKPVTTAFYFALVATVMTAVMLPWGWVTPNFTDLLLLFGVGAFGGIGQLLLTRAYQMALSSVVGPFSYSAILWAMLLGWLFCGEWPTLQVIAGAGIVIGAGDAIIFDETWTHRLARDA
ncbi:MAG: DMT family transporter [Alphaproteobacteria bacterium]